MRLNSPQINLIVKACTKASRLLIRDFGELEKLQVSKKGPKDFVTNSDLKVENIIIKELRKARPNYSILSEAITLTGHRIIQESALCANRHMNKVIRNEIKLKISNYRPNRFMN